MASYELLKSELVSSFGCVGKASAICLRILSVLRGSFAILMVPIELRWGDDIAVACDLKVELLLVEDVYSFVRLRFFLSISTD